ncbi:MAG: virulence RhuM family protein [Bacteroidetes bacterium]|nr:virulence RhuM family protein [Bacteroidota bacterium]
MNSEIIIYQNPDGNIKIDVRLEDETVWLTQDQMATLFGKGRSTVAEHIGNVFEEGELVQNRTCRKFRQVRQEGNREVEREIDHYNLDVIISVGYRVKSPQGTQFLIKDIYTTSIDYDAKDEKTIEFFKVVQNKLLWAISEQTAAELVYRRVDASLPLLGMQSFDPPAGKAGKKNPPSVKKTDVSIAKNYLNEDEIKLLGLLVEQYLAFAETMAQQRTPMYMADWISRLDSILQLNGRELLSHAGKISHEMALEKSGTEFEKFKANKKQIQKEQSLKEIENDIEKIKKLNGK